MVAATGGVAAAVAIPNTVVEPEISAVVLSGSRLNTRKKSSGCNDRKEKGFDVHSLKWLFELWGLTPDKTNISYKASLVNPYLQTETLLPAASPHQFFQL